jgi:hypothetical protein
LGKNLERSLSPKDKLYLVAEQIKLDICFGERPWQSMEEILKFRNLLAHGKSETISKEQRIPSNKISTYLFYEPLTKWEEYCTEEQARRAVEDVDNIIMTIHSKLSIENESQLNPFLGSSTSIDFSST